MRFIPMLLLIGLSMPAQALDPADPYNEVMVTIHCDPGATQRPGYIINGKSNWERLEDVVAAADANDLVLTIQMTYPWAQYANTKLRTVAGWIASGHRLGFHHHDVTHLSQPAQPKCAVQQADWSLGWGAGSWAAGCQPYWAPGLGYSDLQTLASNLATVGASVVLDNATHGPESDMRQFEWRPTVPYSQTTANGAYAGQDPAGNALGTVGCEYYKRHVVQIGATPFEVVSGGSTTTVDVVDDILHHGHSHDYVVVTFHAHEYTAGNGNKATVDGLFTAIATHWGPNRTMSDVLSSYSCP